MTTEFISTEVKLLIFDLDGTLIDSSSDIANSVNVARKSLGLELWPTDQIKSHLGDGARRLVERCLPESNQQPDNSELSVDRALHVFKTHYTDHCAIQTKLYNGVESTLQKLKSNYQFAVLTNKGKANTVTILKALKIDSLFKLVVGGDEFCLKPCVDGIEYIMQILSVDASSTVMIGDHHTDLEVGRRVGVQTIFCKFGFGNQGNENPTRSIQNFGQLLDLLQK